MLIYIHPPSIQSVDASLLPWECPFMGLTMAEDTKGEIFYSAGCYYTAKVLPLPVPWRLGDGANELITW